LCTSSNISELNRIKIQDLLFFDYHNLVEDDLIQSNKLLEDIYSLNAIKPFNHGWKDKNMKAYKIPLISNEKNSET
jgi:hypothetical protein